MNDDSDEDKMKDLEKSLNNGKLTNASMEILSSLTVREAKVLYERIGVEIENDHCLEEIGKQFDITRQRIKAIEEKALRKLRGKDPDDDPGAA